MKILFIDYCVDVAGGVERVINCLANEMVADNEVKVLSQYKFTRDSFFEYDKRVKKEYLCDRMHDRFKKNVRSKFLSKIDNGFYRIGEKNSIRKYLAKNKDVDVIVFGRIFMALRFVPVLKEMGIRPKIIVRDAIHFFDLKKRHVKLMKKYFPSMVDCLIVSSDESAKVYRSKLGSNNVRIKKIYNPIGIDPVVGYNFSNKAVVSIGRMDDDQKGFTNLIRAFCLVNKKHPDWVLRIYGDGCYKIVYDKIIRELGASEFIEILPSVKDVVKVLNEASIFVLASRYEGYANILVEAMVCGVPSISYNWLMGVDEIIEDQKNGIVVKLKDRFAYASGINNMIDCERLAVAISAYIEDSNKAKLYSKNSIKIAESRNIKDIINKWKDLISDQNFE